MGTGNKNEILEQIKSHKGVFLLYIFLRIMVAVVMVRQFLAGNFQYVFLCILVLFLTFSNFIYFVSGRGYTHASLALDDKNESYYSFNFRGFRKEYPKKYRHRSKSSISYTLEIPKEDYEKIREKIKEMEHGKEKFHYSRIGVLLCLLHIPFRRKNYYFCSQFVTEMLQMSDAVLLRKDASLYLPNDLPDELGRQSCLKEIICNPV